MKPNVVIYHKSDFDGIFCREIAKKKLGDSAEYIGWEYGEPNPEVPAEVTLYIMDLSVPDLMDHPNLIWIDHHKSAIEKYDKDGRHRAGIRIDGVAACRLAWQYFFGPTFIDSLMKEQFVDRKVNEPLAVRLAGEYDIWDKRDPHVDLFQRGLYSMELTAYHWDAMLSPMVGGAVLIGDIIDRGRVVNDYQKIVDEQLLKYRAFDLHWNGLTFLAINHARCNSLTFESGAKEYHDGLLSFCWTGTKWTISMYHTAFNKEIDLSAIAVAFGGGGHKGACGFTCKTLPFVI